MAGISSLRGTTALTRFLSFKNMPTVAARYWRIGFRSATSTSSGHLALSTLRVFEANFVDRTSSATVTIQSLLSGSSVANLSDGNNATAGVMTFSNSGTFQYITYDFGAGNTASLETFLIRVSSTVATGTTRISAPNIDMLTQSSFDNTLWSTQAVLPRLLTADDIDQYAAVIPDSFYYPTPVRSQLWGPGGIYGIVSEDGVALPNRPVILYDREDFSKVGYTTTDINGGYTFNGLNTNREFLVMSADPSGPPYKNALVYDRITPINALAQLPAQSPFWALRLRSPRYGFSFALTRFLDGVSINEIDTAPGSITPFFSSNSSAIAAIDGLTASTALAAQGAFSLVKSSRTSSTARGVGLMTYGGGYFEAPVATGNEVNSLSFELVCIPPTPAESSPLLAIWLTNADSTDSSPIFTSSGFFQLAFGVIIEVLSTSVNVRMGLGSSNFNVIRASAPVVQGQINHIVVTYERDSEIKLYVNGALQATTSIPGSGRLVTASVTTSSGSSSSGDITQWANPFFRDFARRIAGFALAGSGVYTVVNYPPAWSGFFGEASFWGRVLSQADVTDLYNSLIDTANFTPLSTLSGYAGEVEADVPSYYFRLNETAAPANIIRPIIGRQALNLTYRPGTTFGVNAGFVAGNTAVDFSNSAGAYVTGNVFSSTFSVEMWVRPTSLAATTCLFSVNAIDTPTDITRITQTSGILSLRVYDRSGGTTLITFSHTALVVNTSYHIVVTYDPWVEKTAKLYINGALTDTKNAPAIPFCSDSFFHGIGCRASNSVGFSTTPTFNTEHFTGAMGEVALYAHRLTAARVQAHYDARNF